MRTLSPFVCLAATVAAAPGLQADDSFAVIPLSSLTITEGELPAGAPANGAWWTWDRLRPYAVMDGAGEAFVTGQDGFSPHAWSAQSASLTIRMPGPAEAAGTLYVPNADWTGLERVRFTARVEGAPPDARTTFLRAKAAHYDDLWDRGIPGGAFFRWQADDARRSLGDEQDENRAARAWARPDLGDTYDLFVGGRALAENLQLDRPLPDAPDASAPLDSVVPIDSIRGITVAEFDWSARLAGAAPALDPLASSIPADQHGAFFPSLDALEKMLEQINDSGLPVVRSVAPRSEDSRIVDRYARQLGVPADALSQALAAGGVLSVAITGSDPYFPTGTDVAVLFQTNDPAALRSALLARLEEAIRSGSAPTAERLSGEIGGARFDGFRSPDRRICSYISSLGSCVVVTNSEAQLARLVEVAAGRAPSLASLKEFSFFRTRYPLGAAHETGFIFVSDPTIRRWCGPEWRIGASRRLRASAIMADVTAQHCAELVTGNKDVRPVQADTPMRTIGELSLASDRVTSSVYGNTAFMTPIIELGITEVMQDEARSYDRWRDGYERNWSWAFDPIGMSFGIAERGMSADLTVMPLIASTQYRQWIEITRGVSLGPASGDPHDSIAHGVAAVNRDSAPMQQFAGVARSFSPGIDIDPFGWLGASVALYADPDPFWEELRASDDTDDFMEANIARLPVGLFAEVGSTLKLTAFLAAARAFIEQSAPGNTLWETRMHNGQAYVRVGLSPQARAQAPGGAFDDAGVYYAAMPRGLTVSLSESLVQRAIDRQLARAAAGAGNAAPADGPSRTTQPVPPDALGTGWLGSSIALRFTREGLTLVQGAGRDAFRAQMQQRAWGNLPILNEWRRRFPDKDPLDVHAALWHSTPICPGGGQYVWNEKFQTMESTVYGHPGEPRPGPDTLAPLEGIDSGALGVTFESDGLRARGSLQRANE